MGFARKRLGGWITVLLSMPACGQSELPLRPPDSTTLQVVSLLGASVTAGYSVERPGTTRLQKVLEGIWDRADVSVRDRSDIATFIDPVTKQGPRLRRVLRDKPDLVIAIDFMFWFGYGRISGDEMLARLEMQEEGLALLEQLDCPILVGDYPDMREADSRILRLTLVPAPAVLEALNERLHRWVAERDSVHLFPLAEWVARAVHEGEIIRHEEKRLRVPPLGMLQRDGLHANRLGMALMGYRIAEQLSEIFPPGSALRPQGVTLEALVERCRAELEVSELPAAESVRAPAQRDK